MNMANWEEHSNRRRVIKANELDGVFWAMVDAEIREDAGPMASEEMSSEIEMRVSEQMIYYSKWYINDVEI